MIPIKDIIPIWQTQGYSTNHLAKSIGSLYGVKATHTGTLDPMAEGVVIVLTGDTRLKRQELSSSVKGYEFEILFGVSTDSFDGMGIITGKDFSKDIKKDDLAAVCNSMLGEYKQTVPIFSAQLYKGKKLFEWGHLKENIPLPIKEGTIHRLDLLSLNRVPLDEGIGNILAKLHNIRGNFRQGGIIKQWEGEKDIFSVYKAKFYAEVSRGLYIRSLSQDICTKLNTLGFVYSLCRVKNGIYDKSSCVSLVDLFGTDYDNILKLQN